MRRITVFTLALTILLLVFIQPQTVQAATTRQRGPRSDVSFSPYPSPDAAYTALKAGNVDIMCWPLTVDQYIDAVNDPNLQLAASSDLAIFEFDFNNNYTISNYPGIRSPMSYLSFRQALAYLIDKDHIINVTLGGFGYRIDVPIPKPLAAWWNQSVTGANYPYPHDPFQTAALLDADGFVQGSTPNPYYDPGVPWSSEYIRTYPPDHPQKPGEDLDPILFYARSDEPARLAVGEILRDAMRTIGIPVNWVAGPAAVIYQKVFVEKDYHIYTGGGSVSRFPPQYMFYMFHSMFWCTRNYVTGVNASGLPNYPDLDEELASAYYAPNYASSIPYCKNAQSLLVAKYCVSVWLWSPKSWYAYRNLLGVADMEGYGINNKYTYINAYRVDDPNAPIRVAIPSVPDSLNVLYARSYSDWQILNAIYTHLMNVPPYDLSADQPWVAQDWEVGTWLSPEGIQVQTNVTFWIRKDAGIVGPVPSPLTRNYTAHDVEFTIWYNYAFRDAWNWGAVSNVDHTRIIDDHTIQVYFDEYSYWLLYSVGMEMPLLPKDELISQLCFLSNTTFSLPQVFPSTKYEFTDQQVIQMVSLSRDAVDLVEGVDYEIVVNSTEYTHNVIHFLTPQPAGTYYATYYTPKWKPTGYYLGSDYGLNWTDTMYTPGPHYPATNPVGLKANRHFFLETPPLGEIDFVWKWEIGPKPQSGHFKIDIFDVVLAASAYGSTGNGVPDPHWFPGADLAPPECIINIFDIVAVTGHYGQEYGRPPSDP